MSARCALRVTGSLALLLAAWLAVDAAFIPAKAVLAQQLLERAWRQSAGGERAVRPWPGADTAPAARLAFPTLAREMLVLDGASARNLAFGPVHVAPTAWPGGGGATVLAGHRDTHFRVLRHLEAGDAVVLERGGHRHRFVVTGGEVVHRDVAAHLAAEAGEARLLLVTCYPFDALHPGTPWRYVVSAVPPPA